MLRHDRGAHPYRCNHFTLTRHRSVARAAQSLGRSARTHAWPRIRPEARMVAQEDRVSEFATVMKASKMSYHFLLASWGTLGNLSPLLTAGRRLRRKWTPCTRDGGSGDARGNRGRRIRVRDMAPRSDR